MSRLFTLVVLLGFIWFALSFLLDSVLLGTVGTLLIILVSGLFYIRVRKVIRKFRPS